MVNKELYETVIGLEVHAQLQTQSKLFCGDSVAFGSAPNTHVSPITLAHPGTLPRMNRKAIEYAITIGLACECEIQKANFFARKNYFYPDLPKGFQVSQHTTPICQSGKVKIIIGDIEKIIRLNRIHLEEDAGKSLHDADKNYTCVDYNRAGTALIEMVTEPDLRSGDEAYTFLTEIRKLVRWLGICDGNMEEGSLRCDANISVRKKGETALGTKTEIKNLNSIRNVKRAIDAESERLIAILEEGGLVVQQTRSFDADIGKSFAIRDKEDADDYRYFTEPDLSPFHLQQEYIDKIRASMPVLPSKKAELYKNELNLSGYDASLLTEDRSISDYFDALIKQVAPKPAANWMLGPVKSWLNEHNAGIESFPVPVSRVAELINMVEAGKLSFTVASTKVFSALISDPRQTAEKLAEKLNLFQQSDESVLNPVIEEVLNSFAAKVSEYKKGKKGLLALFVGEVMKRTGGKADPKLTQKILIEKLGK